MRKSKLTGVLILCLLGFLRVAAQIKPVIHYTENDGLAGNLVRDLLLDNQKILWIATDYGISRFDGMVFDNLNQSNGLPSNRVGALAMGERGEIYAGCSNGGLVSIMNNSCTNLLQTNGKIKEVFRSLYYSKYYHILLVGTESGLYVLHDKRLVPINYPKDTTDRSIVLSISGKDADIFFTLLKGKSQGVFKLKFNPASPEKSYADIVSTKSRFVSVLVNGKLFSGSYDSLYIHSTNDLSAKLSGVGLGKGFFVWKLHPYKNGLIWAGGLGDGRFKGDILIYDSKKTKVYPSRLPQNIQSVTAILYDSISGVTWFGRDNGLTVFKDSPFEFIDLQGKEMILDADYAGDSLLILTENRILYYHNGKFNQLLTKAAVKEKVLSKYNETLRKSANRNNFSFDLSYGFEFASFGKDGNKVYVKTGNGAISVPDMRQYIPMGVGSFTVLKNGSIYLAEKYRPALYRPSVNDVLDYQYIEATLSTTNETFEIQESNGVYYFASKVNGLLTIREKNVIRLSESNSSLENNLKDIDKDPDGNLWCLSERNHLYQIGYDVNPSVVKEIDLQNLGLTGSSCKWFKFAGNQLFIATNEGLNVLSFNKLMSASPVIEHFYNGYNGYKFIAAIAPVLDGLGNLVVHTDNEVIVIHPDKFIEHRLQLNVYQVKINNKLFDINSLNNRQLPFSTEQISFAFRAIKYPSAQNISYRYKINNETWVNGNRVNLQSLRAGSYVIQMELTNRENNQTVSGEIRFIIERPFWLTVWFIALLIILTGVTVYFVFRQRYINLRKREAEKTRLLVQNAELQLRSLQIQMNPHFVFNALTSMQNFMLAKNVKEGLIYLNTLSSILRTNLENAREEYILLMQEVEFLTKYIEIEKIRFKDKLQITLVNDTRDPNILIPPMLIQPLIENAIKHGITPKNDGGYVQVIFEQTDKSLVVTVEDNGIGRQASQKPQATDRQHLGLSVIRKRLELLNALEKTNNNKLNIIDLNNEGTPSGTRIKVILSLKVFS